jgi:tRNA-2-methylthio-N6-dimethylallyladenosine synthase
MIAGFCTETEEEHQDTLTLMDYSGFDMSYMYFYSERPGTLAARRFKDDISLEDKKRRLQEIVDKQGELSTKSNLNDIGKTFKILIETRSKRDANDWTGRTSQNKITVFPKSNESQKPGDYVWVKIQDCTRATLLGTIVDHP